MSDRTQTTNQSEAGVPTDQTTLVEVIEGYRQAGCDTDFVSLDGAAVQCGNCEAIVPADQLAVHSLRRLEGASDPADMVAVVATACPVCESAGTLVLGFGPAASAIDSDVLSALRDKRAHDDLLPRDATPDEAADEVSL